MRPAPDLGGALAYNGARRNDGIRQDNLFADYIDDTRTYDDCVKLRGLFFGAEPEKMDADARMRHFDRLIVMSFDMTLAELVGKGSLISADTVNARNFILCGLKNR